MNNFFKANKGSQRRDIERAKELAKALKGTRAMTVEFSAFEISDYLDDEKVIGEYLLVAADDPNPEVLSRAKSDVVKARAANSVHMHDARA
jgi:hypothetical protein